MLQNTIFSFSIFLHLFFKRFFVAKKTFILSIFFLIFGISGLYFNDTSSTDRMVSLYVSPKILPSEENYFLNYLSNSKQVISFQKYSQEETKKDFLSQFPSITTEEIPEIPLSYQLILSPNLSQSKMQEFLSSIQSFKGVMFVDSSQIEGFFDFMPSWSQSIILWIIILSGSFFWVEYKYLQQFSFFNNEWYSLQRFGAELSLWRSIMIWDGIFLALTAFIFECTLVFILWLIEFLGILQFHGITFFDVLGFLSASIILFVLITILSAVTALNKFLPKLNQENFEIWFSRLL